MSDLLSRDAQYVWHPYTQMKTAPSPLPIVKGEGALLFTEDGRTLIDGISSWWVNIHGHSHPYIAERIAAQALELEHVIFSGFTHPPAVDLAEKLIDILPGNMARVFYSDNGSTAVEIAVKMAIQYFYNQGMSRPGIIAFEQAFHGETFGAMSLSGELALFDAFEKHLFRVDRIPAPFPGREQESLDALEAILKQGDTCAFIFEPLIMGAGGMLMYEPEALDALIKCCHEHGALAIADEVMTGFGRTGKIFACDYLEETPDLMCLAKGLTGGVLPLSATVCTADIFNAFYSEDKKRTLFHGHSFTANPLGCAAALASMDLTLSETCQNSIARLTARHRAFIEEVKAHPTLIHIRARGTILAMEFHTPDATSYFNNMRDQLYNFFLDQDIILRPLGNVVYVMPPYCLTDEQLEKIYAALREAMEAFKP
ncbi:adenosylmethionine--8-amino-7-oxononanoate transaminase [Flavilitoribacter nigricans]|uniref:Adenosylmethionine-8-amino-7-oxononanoate aminotransferase n=1 Tax=Flavilitoribacter nigricans (strain ATCC 23147 / DSM 23189 / NBRC 102662 / NCIMB 1420 / SS-2) TaxID=1122177 RepID=A0A2D0N3B3_FLAN2|nr:adenosylmethionine--8-amino-7-oxononanoate transaminase [Flavilitoribacter nigricans]PHN02878.1 adenosylmethionine--8-amino-7-oxononanoate transaminase [Flavilitoribacter nigricans DSM 23189 = NBRC 102662]